MFIFTWLTEIWLLISQSMGLRWLGYCLSLKSGQVKRFVESLYFFMQIGILICQEGQLSLILFVLEEIKLMGIVLCIGLVEWLRWDLRFCWRVMVSAEVFDILSIDRNWLIAFGFHLHHQQSTCFCLHLAAIYNCFSFLNYYLRALLYQSIRIFNW